MRRPAGAMLDGLEEPKDVWLFPDPVIRHEFRARAADLRMITIDGDSMEPLLASGDRILLDTSQRVPVPPGIFVIWDGLGLVAKRVEHVPHSEPPKIVITSVNPEYQAYERDAEEVNIVGRVVWAAKRLWEIVLKLPDQVGFVVLPPGRRTALRLARP